MSEESRNSDCPEEGIGHGDLGIVEDEEMLVRISPDNQEHIDENGFFRRAALQVKDFLTEGDGLSLYRHMYIDNMAEKLRQHAADPNKNGKHCYALVKAVCIRRIADRSSKRAICVIDDPQEGDPAHALAQKVKNYGEDEAREIRNRLLREFDAVIKSPQPTP